MPTYILLSKLTPKGRRTLRRKPERLAQVNLEIKDLGYQVRSQYALVGEYDFFTIIDAPDNESMAQLSVSLGSRGTVAITTLAAVGTEELAEKLKGAAQMGRAEKDHQHTRFYDRDTGKKEE